jgi:hypothetical protein
MVTALWRQFFWAFYKSPLRFVSCLKCLHFPLKRGIGKVSDFRKACSVKTRIADSMLMLVVEIPLVVYPIFVVSAFPFKRGLAKSLIFAERRLLLKEGDQALRLGCKALGV